MPAQGKELLDVKDLRLAGGIEPGGPAVRGQHDAVLIESCQGLGHETPLIPKVIFVGGDPWSPH